MPQNAYSLNIGLNAVNPDTEVYDGWNGAMEFCEKDASDMEEIAHSLNFTSTKLLLGEKATRPALFKEVEKICKKMNSCDLFVLTFSGHGGLVLDLNGDEEDSDCDQTWCFFDGHVVDDEIHNMLKTFKQDHRVLIISDSCYSGTIFRGGPGDSYKWGRTTKVELEGVLASVQLLASSLDHETSKSGRKNGLFTGALLKAWNNGTFPGNYKAFYRAIVSDMPWNGQTPNHLIAGTPDLDFLESKPFNI